MVNDVPGTAAVGAEEDIVADDCDVVFGGIWMLAEVVWIDWKCIVGNGTNGGRW